MNPLMALLGGGALPPLGDLIKLPCAVCLALDVETPADAVTLAGGSLACAEHVRDALPVDVCHDLDTGRVFDVGRRLVSVALAGAEARDPGTIERLTEGRP